MWWKRQQQQNAQILPLYTVPPILYPPQKKKILRYSIEYFRGGRRAPGLSSFILRIQKMFCNLVGSLALRMRRNVPLISCSTSGHDLPVNRHRLTSSQQHETFLLQLSTGKTQPFRQMRRQRRTQRYGDRYAETDGDAVWHFHHTAEDKSNMEKRWRLILFFYPRSCVLSAYGFDSSYTADQKRLFRYRTETF